MTSALPHVSPADRCACVVCDAAHLVRWRTLSAAQRRALAALDRTIPRHLDDLKGKGIRWTTLASLMQRRRHQPALAEQLDLRRPMADARYYHFAVLSVKGAGIMDAARKAGLVA